MSRPLLALRIDPKKVPRRIKIPNHHAALEKEVGGAIDVRLPFRDGVALIVKWDAKENGAPLNRTIRDQDGIIRDTIAGPFLVVGLGRTHFLSLTPKQIAKYEALFYQPKDFIQLPSQLIEMPVQVEQ